ncbi:MAG: hypothetical protein J6I85_01265 [Clostridia bacterium]|nr:hypothetical protein [Clostridia bacterium]
MEKIYLNDILNIPVKNVNEYKIRFLIKDPDNEEPLDQILDNDNKIVEWTGWKQGAKFELTRKYVISFVRIYTEGKEYWLYLGTYDVEKREDYKSKVGQGYDLKKVKEHEKYIKRLVVKYKNKIQNTKPNLENIINDIEVYKIMSEEEVKDFYKIKRL